DDARKANPAIVYCSVSGYGGRGPASQWAGHDLDYLAMGGYLDCSGRRADGGPALPGATIADAAAGGMQAAIAILAALLRRAATGAGEHLDVSVTDGVLSLMALAIDQQLATGEAPGPGRDLLTGRYACYDLYAARDGGWLAVAAIEPAFWANLCRALELGRWIPHQLDDARQAAIRARPSRRGIATSGWPRWRRPTPAWRPCSRWRSSRVTSSSGRAAPSGRRSTPRTAASASSAPCSPARPRSRRGWRSATARRP